MSTTRPDATNLRPLYQSFGALNVVLRRQVARRRQEMDTSVREDLLGLFVTDIEIDRLLGAIGANGHDTEQVSKVTISPESSLALLAGMFNLDAFAQRVVLLGLAPEIDPRYERIYSYLHNDVTRKRPSVGLAMDLFCTESRERVAAREAFHPASPLIRHRIVSLATEEAQGLPAPLPARAMRLDDRIVSFLLGLNHIDPVLDDVAGIWRAGSVDIVESVTADDGRSIRHMVDGFRDRSEPTVICLSGHDQGLKRDVARFISGSTGRSLVALDAKRLPEGDAGRGFIERAFREALLRGGAVFVEGFDEAPGVGHLVADTIECYANTKRISIVLSSTAPWEQIRFEIGEGMRVISLALGPPSVALRTDEWRRNLPSPLADAAEELASRYRLNGGQVRRAVREAHGYALLRGEDRPALADFARAARAQSTQALGRLATKLDPRQSWEDLVLPTAQREQLRSIDSHLRHRHLVLETWGFADRMGQGSGVTALFAGPSGTGKTMAAGVIARSLDLDIYRIDLSAVVSKYIGETEKNLSQVFHEAESANAVLFFDEADALFGKRSEVSNAHDRYANIEVAYLLQRMEAFDGLAILGTNLREHLDAAFARRLQFVVSFPFPEAPEREEIWKRHLPAKAPLASDIDYEILAGFPLSGGNIRNCVLTAAYMAAEGKTRIGMEQLAHSVAGELRKIGRPVLQSQFGDYYRYANAAPRVTAGGGDERS